MWRALIGSPCTSTRRARSYRRGDAEAQIAVRAERTELVPSAAHAETKRRRFIVRPPLPMLQLRERANVLDGAAAQRREIVAAFEGRHDTAACVSIGDLHQLLRRPRVI